MSKYKYTIELDISVRHKMNSEKMDTYEIREILNQLLGNDENIWFHGDINNMKIKEVLK